jgi:hypothetical protein
MMGGLRSIKQIHKIFKIKHNDTQIYVKETNWDCY